MDGPRITLDDIRDWPLTVDVPDAAKALGVSPSLCFTLIRQGGFPCRVLPIGKRRYKVVTQSLLAFLEGKEELPAPAPDTEVEPDTPEPVGPLPSPEEIESWFVKEPILPPNLRPPGGKIEPDIDDAEVL